MGQAYYCDRCEELNDEFKFPSFDIKIEVNGDDFEQYTLCLGCKEKIESWFLGDNLKEEDVSQSGDEHGKN